MSESEVHSGEVSDGAVLNYGDHQVIDGGGIANHTTINASGQQTLAPGAVTHDVVVNLGGMQDAAVGGQTYDTVLNGGQQQLNYYMVAHGSPTFSMQGAEHTIINSGGTQFDQGRAFDTVINDGGTQSVTGFATGTVINYGGAQNIQTAYLADYGYTNTVSGTIINDGGVQNIFSGSAVQTHLMPGGAITIQSVNYAEGGSVNFDPATGTLTVVDNGQTVNLNLAGDYSQTGFSLSASTAQSTTAGGKLSINAAPLCFCRGTKIRTAKGEIAIETIQVGDEVLTTSGRNARVCFMASTATFVNDLNRPVIVRAGSFGIGVPYQDLFVTRGHSFLFGDVLIPIGALVNGESIRWSQHTRSMEVFHIGLDRHDIVLSNGAPAESYRNDGNGSAFTAWSGDRGEPGVMPTCAPVVAKGPIVERTYARLASRFANSATTQSTTASL